MTPTTTPTISAVWLWPSPGEGVAIKSVDVVSGLQSDVVGLVVGVVDFVEVLVVGLVEVLVVGWDEVLVDVEEVVEEDLVVEGGPLLNLKEGQDER